MIPHSDSPRITAAICTYNRAADLGRTLETLVDATGGIAWPWELLVIDNNSSDETREVAQSFAERLPLRYVFEPAQGLSRARNRALAEARSSFLVFTDDDVDLQPGWLEAYVSLLDRCPDLAFAGGRVLPAWQGTPPEWFVRFTPTPLLSGVAVWYDEGDEEFVYAPPRVPFYGANVGFRVDAVQALGGFDPRLGVQGGRRGAGEETLAIERLVQAGHRGVYSPAALVRHRLGPDRWNRRCVFRFAVADGVRSARLCRTLPRRWVGSVPLYTSQRLLRAALRYLRFGLTTDPDQWLPALVDLGKAWGAWQEFRARQREQVGRT